ncbi:hypothetical protein B0H15DRAFT_957710 [Mycena belliarum]|uniref:Uncharacterized protein n=1 Tax=Mycena belliarum TaxID=1033014 RepID=A0AAD6TPD7_9AGAR|nr:hypothetical protein B0H15DRAFT_957710 [Mycena belliae]
MPTTMDTLLNGRRRTTHALPQSHPTHLIHSMSNLPHPAQPRSPSASTSSDCMPPSADAPGASSPASKFCACARRRSLPPPLRPRALLSLPRTEPLLHASPVAAPRPHERRPLRASDDERIDHALSKYPSVPSLTFPAPSRRASPRQTRLSLRGPAHPAFSPSSSKYSFDSLSLAL